MSTEPLATLADGALVDPARWVDEFGDYLYRYAFSRLHDSNAAEEVVQEAFLAGVRYRDQYAGRGTEQAWLLGILKRKIIDYVRLRMKHGDVTSFDEEADPSRQLFDGNGSWKSDVLSWAPAPDHKMQMDELWNIVQDCLKCLPESQTDVFVLSVMEDMDSDEVCEQLDISPANFWVRMHRARLGLAKCVGARWSKSGEVNING